MASPPDATSYTVHLLPDQVRQLEMIAEREQRGIDELMAESVQLLWANRIDKLFAETSVYAATRNPHGFQEADVPRLLRETRAEIEAEQKLKLLRQSAVAP